MLNCTLCLYRFTQNIVLNAVIFYKVQKWLGNEKNPLDWGWMRSAQGPIPQLMTKPPAPQALLNMISCTCKKGCTNNCGCRKAGLKCSAVCNHCSGQSCENIADLIDDIDETLIDDPPSDDDLDLPDDEEVLTKQATLKRSAVDLEDQPGPSKIYKIN